MMVLILAAAPDRRLLHSDTVSSRAVTFFFHPTQRKHSSTLTEEKEPAGSKLSTKSKLYVHDMSQAMLTFLSVCLASAKLIVVVLSFPSFTPLPGEKHSVLLALRKKREA